MSYDFELFASRKFLLEPPSTSATCNVCIDGPDHAEDEDLPDNYLTVLGKKRVLFRIHVEGVPTSDDQLNVDRWLTAIVAQTKGVLIDLQTEQFATLTKSGQLAAIAPKPKASGWMTFYFADGEAFYSNGFETMLSDISRLMPEAAAKRFGYYEPLQGRILDSDYLELVKSFKNEPHVFMKSKTPFGHLFVHVPCKKTFERYHLRHFIRRKFLLGTVAFEIRPQLFTNQADFARLMRLFEHLCVSLDVVYAQIAESDHMGGWLWYGLPDNQPHTICVGSAYQEVWPEVLNTGHKIGSHHHVVSTNRFGSKPPRPPKQLIAPTQDDDPIDPKTGKRRDTRDTEPNYAPVFPFAYEFDLTRYLW